MFADDVAGDDHLDTAIQFTTGGGAVVGDRIGFPETLRSNIVHRHSGTDQIVADGRGALFRKGLVVFVASDAIGVTLDLQLQVGVGEHDS